MIEVKLIQTPVFRDPRQKWIELTPNIGLRNIDFNRAKIRIDGVIYTEKSEECIKAFDTAKLWMTLQDD